MVQGVSGKKSLLAMFQDGYKKNIFSNKLTIVIVNKKPEEKEPDVSAIYEIPEGKVKLEKEYYHCVYVMQQFKKKVGFESK